MNFFGVKPNAPKHEAFFSKLRKKEYHSLDKKGHVYLDYTGGNLYAKSQIDQHTRFLKKNTFGNPHSTNPTSQLATKMVEEARQTVIEFFKAHDYHCVFTQNASGALKIIGECYPFQRNGHFLLLADNHNSVNGIREYCKNKGGSYQYVPVQYEDLNLDSDQLEVALNEHNGKENKLFAFPAQSNVSGVKHDLSWIEKAQDKGWDVLLDAAAFAPSSQLNLNEVKPDFVTLSFYKIFGYPTGIGCLLVKKSKYEKLQKQWFAGGTVKLAAVNYPSFFLADNHERFENGTLNYLDIPALTIGFNYIEQIGINRITERVESLIGYLCNALRDLEHSSGEPIVRLFGPLERAKTGGTLIMTFFDKEKQLIPFELVEERANKQMISIRSGCFCNPGIDEVNTCVSTEELTEYFTSRDNGNYQDMVNYLKKMRGATRVSVGLATTQKDLDTFVSFVKGFGDKAIKDI